MNNVLTATAFIGEIRRIDSDPEVHNSEIKFYVCVDILREDHNDEYQKITCIASKGLHRFLNSLLTTQKINDNKVTHSMSNIFVKVTINNPVFLIVDSTGYLAEISIGDIY